jgi:prolyl-tRNA editing enzyme YbaK/EbsC (Cys-tRNA(Pro) deacylase)
MKLEHLTELETYLRTNKCDFEIIRHDEPILKTSDAAKYFDASKDAPTFVMETEQGLVAFIASAKRGRIDFKAIKEQLGFAKFKLADRDKIFAKTGYEAGSIPLVGLRLPYIFDVLLLENEYIYGGTGDALHTLKIAPGDIQRINNVGWMFE